MLEALVGAELDDLVGAKLGEIVGLTLEALFGARPRDIIGLMLEALFGARLGALAGLRLEGFEGFELWGMPLVLRVDSKRASDLTHPFRRGKSASSFPARRVSAASPPAPRLPHMLHRCMTRWSAEHAPRAMALTMTLRARCSQRRRRRAHASAANAATAQRLAFERS